MCVNHKFKKYDALKLDFLLQACPGEWYNRLKDAFHDQIFEIYLLFYPGVLPKFTSFNKY